MKLAGAFDKWRAIVRRDLLTLVRYRSGLLTELVTIVAEIVGLYYLARAVGPGFQPDGIGYFPFLLVGTAAFQLMMGGVSAFVSSLSAAQLGGTMEVLMTTSTPPVMLIALTATTSMTRPVVVALVYFAAGAVFLPLPLSHANLAAVLLILLLLLGLTLACCMAAATVQIALYKGGAFNWALGTVAGLLSGVMFPVSALPAWAQTLALLTPSRYALDALRLALFRGELPSRDIGLLALFVAVLLPVTTASLLIALRRARIEGTLSFY